MDKIVFVVCVLALLNGCGGTIEQYEETRDEVLERAGQAADKLMDRGTAYICSGRMSVRAVVEYIRRRGLTREEFVAFCNWSEEEAALLKYVPPTAEEG